MGREKQLQAGTVRFAMNDHFVGVKNDLSHVQALLSDAITGLFEEMQAISDACRRQQKVLSELKSQEMEQLAAENRVIDLSAKELLVHLQFQDMVHQLLDHAKARLDAVESLGFLRDEQASNNDQSFRSSSHSESVGARGAIDELSMALAASPQMMKSKPVKAQDMSAGDIELF